MEKRNVSTFIAQLQDLSSPIGQAHGKNALALSEELLAIQCIYGDEAFELQESTGRNGTDFVLQIPLDTDEQAEILRLLIALPPHYPHSQEPPRLALIDRGLGTFTADQDVKSFIDTIFTQKGSVRWTSGEPILFEGIEAALEYVRGWLHERKNDEAGLRVTPTATENNIAVQFDRDVNLGTVDPSRLVSSELITARKSEFLGHAAALNSPDEVPAFLKLVLASDKRVQRAAHPIIHAWTATTMAKRLLEADSHTFSHYWQVTAFADIQGIESGIVIVTRWFGGVLLGPDRFKHINRAARDALVKAGLVAPPQRIQHGSK